VGVESFKNHMVIKRGITADRAPGFAGVVAGGVGTVGPGRKGIPYPSDWTVRSPQKPFAQCVLCFIQGATPLPAVV
jgi:hypothetical protein